MQTKTLDLVARSGYAARGVVYLIIGGLAVAAAVGSGKTVGSKGALATLSGEPWGQAVLVSIALGLFGYSLWRAVQALLDADGHGTGAKALVIRAGLFVSAVTHVLLGVYALSLPFTLGAASGGGGSSTKGAVAWVLQQPFGIYLLFIAGICVFGAGVAQFWKGLSGKYQKRLDVDLALMTTLSPICAFGLAARGVVFMIVGGFVLYAAYTYDPDQAGGLAEALHWLRAQAYGQVLFLIVALGLFAFGAYSVIEAVWRTINVEAVPGSLTRGSVRAR